MKKYLCLALCALTFLNTGCVATAVVAGAGATGAIVSDKRDIKQMNRDREASQSAIHAISRDTTLNGRSHISASTFNGLMLLVGQAQSPELKQRAYDLAKAATTQFKVHRIYNEIQISGASSFLERSSDTWLTTKVKTALLSKKGLRSMQVKVITESGTVYLLGLVSKEQGQLAAQTARHVAGVKKVVKAFQYVAKQAAS